MLGLVRAGDVIAASDYEGLGVPGAHPNHDEGSVAHGVIDSVCTARELVPEASRRWLVYPGVGHDGVLEPSFHETIGWIRARVAGDVADSACGV